MVKRQRFTAEFKREAVRLLDAGELKGTWLLKFDYRLAERSAYLA